MANKKAEQTKPQGKALLVTTQHRGVFFGYGQRAEKQSEIELTQARMAVSWSTDMRGVFGLAVVGPSNSCKIGMAVPVLTLCDVTAVAECTPEAVEKWEKAPW